MFNSPTRILFVAGNFSDNPEEIRPSGYISKLLSSFELEKLDAAGGQLKFQNGGTFAELQGLLDSVDQYDVILWFANVPNTFEKLVNDIKVRSPHAILVTSKNNIDRGYSYHEITSRILAVKSNLCLVFTKNEAGAICGTLMDPLMNGFCNQEPDVDKVGKSLIARVTELLGYTRAASIRIGDALPVPSKSAFFLMAQRRAGEFHELIHAHNTERFLGNLSFRCENGFPSYREGDTVFVSRRNVDKRMISQEGFVAVSLTTTGRGNISYFGDNKPSVDTPVQVALYNLYPNVMYMMHAHVYVDGAPMTEEKIPCGALEEVESIYRALGDPAQVTNAAINLRGHGSIVFASELKYFNTIRYLPRPVLEF